MAIYDAIVVGAGPAGSTAAGELARKGWQVLVIDAERWPRKKLCGGGLTLRTNKLLAIDVGSIVKDASTAFRFTFQGRNPVTVRTTDPIVLQVYRQEFDDLLLQAARNAGAEVLCGTRVRGIEFGSDLVRVTARSADGDVHVLQASLLIGADGARGPVAGHLGLAHGRRLVGAVECELPLRPQDRGVMTFDYGLPRVGYSWIFPKQERASVGAISLGRPREPLRATFDRYVRLSGYEPEGSCPKPALNGAAIGIDGNVRRVWRDRAVLVGDAAGLTDPFSAEGIYGAIRSGRLVGETLGSQSPAIVKTERYGERLITIFDEELRWGRRLAESFYRVSGIFHRWLVRRPAYADALVRFTRGEFGHKTLGRLVIDATIGRRTSIRSDFEIW